MMEELKKLGFDSIEDWSELIANVDLDSSEKLAKFEKWKFEDGSKKGLVPLLNESYLISKEVESIKKEITRQIDCIQPTNFGGKAKAIDVKILNQVNEYRARNSSKLNLMREIPLGKVIVIAFSGGESSAYMLKLILEQYSKSHRIIITFCNTGEEDEETFIFAEKIREHYDVEIVWLEYRRGRKFEVVNFKTAYRKTQMEKKFGYPRHPFRYWIEDYGFPQYPNRTCTREMKERTISRYLSSIGVMPRMCVRCVGIRFDEISNRTPDPKQYYPLILKGVTKPFLNRFFENEMPFRLQLPSYLGNCGVCISKAIRGLCTIARHRPEKFDFFKFICEEYGIPDHTYYRNHNTVDSIFEKSKDESIKDAKDNRFDLGTPDLFSEFNEELDSEGACGGTCEAFS